LSSIVKYDEQKKIINFVQRNKSLIFNYSNEYIVNNYQVLETLTKFNSYLNNSIPIKVELNPGESIIIDNHKMLIRSLSNS